MHRFRLSDQRGFTLVELVIIIVILGILAAVAIPKYQDLSGEARESAARSSLGSLRSAITIFYANQAVTTGTATWPTLNELITPGTVMAQGIPANPYIPDTNHPDSVVAGATKGTVVAAASDCGWAYDPTTGEVWLNSNTIGENNW